MASRILLLPITLAAAVYARSHTSTLRVVTASIATPSSPAPTATATTGCAAIASVHAGFFSGNPNATIGDVPPIAASLAYSCLTSVPLVKKNATGLIDWYLPYLEFQTTTAWLKDPPPSYQQPAVDLVGSFNTVRAQVLNGTFSNQYEFEVALDSIIQQAHEGHMALPTGLLSSFLFQVPYELLSISSNGTELPAVFIQDDLTAAANGNISWQPSSVTKMNGQDAQDWLTTYANTKVRSLIEPHADWNYMFKNSGRDWGLNGGASSSALRLSTNYPGTDFLNLTFANGSVASLNYKAYATQDLTGVTNGTDFYKLIGKPNNSTTPSSTTVTLPELGIPYPSPIIAQPGLGTTGHVSGYFLNDTSIAVLSITSFNMLGSNAQTFQSTITDFISQCREAEMSQLVIDLQGNGGGNILLAFDLFKQLFPTKEPFGGARFRASSALNIIGETLSQAPDQLESIISPQSSLTADGTAFTDWKSYFGPVSSHGDLYTETARWNFSSVPLDLQSSSIVVSGYANETDLQFQHWQPEDIVLLTDGFCASTCAVFAEQMRTEMGVRSVVVGGRPQPGPMQAVSGTRGAFVYTTAAVAQLVQSTTSMNSSINASSLPSASAPPIYLANDGSAISFNFRDQVRKAAQDIPLQFAYEAADCRFFYTKEMMVNYTLLWQYAADAVLGNQTEMCVSGSTGQWSAGQNVTDVSGGDNVTSSDGRPKSGAPRPMRFSVGTGALAVFLMGLVVLI